MAAAAKRTIREVVEDMMQDEASYLADVDAYGAAYEMEDGTEAYENNQANLWAELAGIVGWSDGPEEDEGKALAKLVDAVKRNIRRANMGLDELAIPGVATRKEG